MSEMTLEVHLTVDDYRHFQSLLIAGALDGERKQSHYPDFEPVMMFVLISLLVIAGFLIPQEVLNLDLFAVVLGVMLGWFAIIGIRKFRLWQGYQKALPDPGDPAFLNTKYVFDDTGVSWSSDGGSGKYHRSAFGHLFEDDVLILLPLGKSRALVFPKARVGAEDQEAIRACSKGSLLSK